MNREKLDTFEDFQLSNEASQKILEELTNWIISELGNSNNQNTLQLEIQENKEQIIERISALIIRQMWGWPKMQIFLNQNDKIIASSLSLLKD